MCFHFLWKLQNAIFAHGYAVLAPFFWANHLGRKYHVTILNDPQMQQKEKCLRYALNKPKNAFLQFICCLQNCYSIRIQCTFASIILIYQLSHSRPWPLAHKYQFYKNNKKTCLCFIYERLLYIKMNML